MNSSKNILTGAFIALFLTACNSDPSGPADPDAHTLKLGRQSWHKLSA